MFYGPPLNRPEDKLKPPRPTSVKEVPKYIRLVVGGLFSRLGYIFKLVWEAKPSLFLIMIVYSIMCGFLPVMHTALNAKLINALVDAATKNGEPSVWTAVILNLVLLFLVMFVQSFINMLYNLVIRLSGEIVTNHIKMKIIDKARTIDLASFDMPSFYEKLENASREASNRPINILTALFNAISVIISMISYVVILVTLSPWAPIIIIVLAIPTAIVNFTYRKKTFKYMRIRSKDRRQMNYYYEQMINKDTVKEIRIFSLSKMFLDSYKKTFEKYFAGIKKLTYGEGAWNISLAALTTVFKGGIFLYIARLIWKGLATVGDFSLYSGSLDSISSGVATLVSTSAGIYEGTLFIDNKIAFMNEEQTVVPNIANPLKVTRHIAHTIEFKNVSFSYPGSSRKVLNNVSFKLEAGETAVLVGLNGAGKTTLIKILTRLYDPTDGIVLIDGVDIRNYDVESLYDIFGIIFQDFGKYAFTVKENIQFGQIDAEHTDEAVIKAAHQSNADTFIEKLQYKYDTPLMRYFEADGIELSIGQWQKLAVARAFYSDSDVLILDEPTASLDPIAEQEIFSEFDELRCDKTTIFVSHRLSSAISADKIILLDGGVVSEIGNHNELMAKKGKYYTLFSTQAKRYIENSVHGYDSDSDVQFDDVTLGDEALPT